MSVDLRLRHDRLLREQAVEMFERGCGYALTARRLGVPAETVREWQKTYRAIGRNGLFAMGVKYARYDYETKVAAARAVVDGGMSKPGSSPVEWCNRFVSFGVGYALSWSGGSSCWVGWGVSRDLVRMSRLR